MPFILHSPYTHPQLKELVVVTRRFSISNSSFLFIPYVGDGLRVRGRRTRSTSTTYFVYFVLHGHLVIWSFVKIEN